MNALELHRACAEDGKRMYYPLMNGRLFFRIEANSKDGSSYTFPAEDTLNLDEVVDNIEKRKKQVFDATGITFGEKYDDQWLVIRFEDVCESQVVSWEMESK
jgi:hypothetical protein